MIDEPQDRYVTKRWMARYWSVSIRTIERDIRKGAIPVSRLTGSRGRRVRIRMADAVAYGRPAE